MLKVIHIAEIVVRVRFVVFMVPLVGLHCRILVFWLVKLQLDPIGGAVAIVTEIGPAIITADHVFTFCRLGLLGVLAVTDLPEQGLMLKLGLDLAFFFSHGALVQKSICLLFKGLNVVLIEQFCSIQLLDKLLVNSGFTWSSLCAQLHIDEVKDSIFKLFSICLGLLNIATAAACLLWSVVSVVEMSVNFLPDAQEFRLFRLV